jgi:hypothetical protein
MNGSQYKMTPEDYTIIVDTGILLSALFASVTALPIFVYFTRVPWSAAAIALAITLSCTVFKVLRDWRRLRAAERMLQHLQNLAVDAEKEFKQLSVDEQVFLKRVKQAHDVSYDAIKADFETKYNLLKTETDVRYAALKKAFDSLVSPSDCETLRTTKVGVEGLRAYFGSDAKAYRIQMGVGKLPVVFNGWSIGWKEASDGYCATTKSFEAHVEAGIFITTGETIVAYLKNSEFATICLHWPIAETGLDNTPWAQFDEMMRRASTDPLGASVLKRHLLVEAWKDACKCYPRLEGLSLRTID